MAALILSAQSDLKWDEVRRLLQDTTDHVAPSDADYDQANGFSRPPDKSKYGYGRINAYEAVRVVASLAKGGRNGVDVFVRDNYLDWGNTQRPSNVKFNPTADPIPHGNCPDIKLDVAPLETPVLSTSEQFGALVDATPAAGDSMRVYVRVRNRGPRCASNIEVKLFAATGATLPPLPPTVANGWTPVGAPQTKATLAYCGCSAALDPSSDGAGIVSFLWTVPMAGSEHWLLVVVSSDEDGVTTPHPSLSPLFRCAGGGEGTMESAVGNT